MSSTIKIIAGFAGVGKTTLGKKYSNVFDLETSAFKWLGLSHTTEESKGNKKRAKNPEFPQNYIQAVKECMQKYDYVLSGTGFEILQAFEKEGLSFIVVYPDIACKDEYIQRYRLRGNTDEFIAGILSDYETYTDYLATCPHSVKLSTGETLEGYLSQNPSMTNLIKKQIKK